MRRVIGVKVKLPIGTTHRSTRDAKGWRCGACPDGYVRARAHSKCSHCLAEVIEIEYAVSGLEDLRGLA